MRRRGRARCRLQRTEIREDGPDVTVRRVTGGHVRARNAAPDGLEESTIIRPRSPQRGQIGTDDALRIDAVTIRTSGLKECRADPDRVRVTLPRIADIADRVLGKRQTERDRQCGNPHACECASSSRIGGDNSLFNALSLNLGCELVASGPPSANADAIVVFNPPCGSLSCDLRRSLRFRSCS
jgi:hypothetical protein